jgi:glycosyltransferase involved in cell wall biosynthesis
MVKKNQGQYELLKPNLEENFLKVIRNANKFIVLSHYMKNNLIENKFNKDKIELIYPYIRNEKRKNIDRKKTSHRFKILFVGQIIRGKGLDLLIQAVSKVRGDWELNIVGKGNDELFIRHTVSKYGLSNRVHFVGWMEDPSIFYQQSDVLVFPSRWPEPFGLVGLEAFSYNVPVVAFNIGGISEWLVDGENGYCIPPFDLTEMALKIEKLRDDADLRNEMGNTGYNWVEKYTNFEVYQKQIVSILETKEANSLTST